MKSRKQAKMNLDIGQGVRNLVMQLMLVMVVVFGVMWLIGGSSEFPWLGKACVFCLVAFVSLRIYTMWHLGLWKHAYAQAVNSSRYQEMSKSMGADLPNAMKPTAVGRPKGAARKRQKEAAAKQSS